ncbi:uncharacterized protein LOC144577399 isoform X3 [Callithrix jacchus]
MYLQGLDGLYSLVKSEDLQWTTSIRRILTQLQRGQNAHRRNCRAGCRLWRRRTMRWLLGSRGGSLKGGHPPQSSPSAPESLPPALFPQGRFKQRPQVSSQSLQVEDFSAGGGLRAGQDED